VLKAELHTHTADDPHDVIPHDAMTLIDRAADLGFQVLAITLHDKQYDIGRVAGHARDRGIVLISGIERTVCDKHVLLLNFPPTSEGVANFDDVRRLKAVSNGLVIAPHPFFPTGSCLQDDLERDPDLFDAVEVNAFYTRAVDFNRRARYWAHAHAKPLIGNGDVHRLSQLGTTFSLVDAAPDADAVCEAIRHGRVQVESRPITPVHAAAVLGSMFVADWSKHLRVRQDAVVSKSMGSER